MILEPKKDLGDQNSWAESELQLYLKQSLMFGVIHRRYFSAIKTSNLPTVHLCTHFF